MPLRLRSRWWWVPFCVIAFAAAYPLWCSSIGHFLVHAEAPGKAEMVVVLAGDRAGNRLLKAMELVRQGYAPAILVSGPSIYYEAHETDLALPFAIRRGFPAGRLIALTHDALSTRTEVQVLIAELRRRSIHSCDLVTSDYHTRRAGKLFRKYAPDLQVTVVAAPDEFFSPSGWWHSREGRKRTFDELTKTVADTFGGL